MNITGFASEVTMHIFNSLDLPSLSAAGAVCRSWRRCASTVASYQLFGDADHIETSLSTLYKVNYLVDKILGRMDIQADQILPGKERFQWMVSELIRLDFKDQVPLFKMIIREPVLHQLVDRQIIEEGMQVYEEDGQDIPREHVRFYNLRCDIKIKRVLFHLSLRSSILPFPIDPRSQKGAFELLLMSRQVRNELYYEYFIKEFATQFLCSGADIGPTLADCTHLEQSENLYIFLSQISPWYILANAYELHTRDKHSPLYEKIKRVMLCERVNICLIKPPVGGVPRFVDSMIKSHPQWAHFLNDLGPDIRRKGGVAEPQIARQQITEPPRSQELGVGAVQMVAAATIIGIIAIGGMFYK